MSDERSGGAGKAPWHFWVISIIAVLWNAMGALDYFMTKTRNEAYMSQFTPEQLDFLYGLPEANRPRPLLGGKPSYPVGRFWKEIGRRT